MSKLKVVTNGNINGKNGVNSFIKSLYANKFFFAKQDIELRELITNGGVDPKFEDTVYKSPKLSNIKK